MILCRRVAHVIILKALLESFGVKVATLYGNQKNYSDSEVLIGTLDKMGVGFDEKNECDDFQGRESDLLILVTSIASLALFIQAKGRVSRAADNAVFYLVDDMDIPKNHFSGSSKWIKETKGVIHVMKYKKGKMGIHSIDYSGSQPVIIPAPEPKRKKIRIKISSRKKCGKETRIRIRVAG